MRSIFRRPPARVVIIDDTLRQNRVTMVTDHIRLQFAKVGRVLPTGLEFIPSTDRQGRKIQDVVRSEQVFEGPVLKHAIHRAKCWMRSRRFPHDGAPHHIAMFMAAFKKADPGGFDAYAAATI